MAARKTTKAAAAKKTAARKSTAKGTAAKKAPARGRKAATAQEEYPAAPAGTTSLVIVE